MGDSDEVCQYVSFMLNSVCRQSQQAFKALNSVLNLNLNRVRKPELVIDRNETRVNFLLVDDNDHSSNHYLLNKLKALVDERKYSFTDLHLKKMIHAVPGSCRFGTIKKTFDLWLLFAFQMS